MECNDVQAHLPDHLAHTLPPDVAAQVASHLRACAACAAEYAAVDDTWQKLRAVPAARADSAAMQARFERGLDDYLLEQRAAIRPHHTFAHYGLQFAAAAALVLLGIAIGRQAAHPSADPEIAALRDELRGMREMVTLSLLQQQSASERLKGVAWSTEIERPDVTVTAALLDTLMHDPNASVRLRTIEALKRFAERDDVRHGALEALSLQTNPMVQLALIDFVVETNGRAAADALRRIANDPMTNEAVRTRAARGLQQVG